MPEAPKSRRDRLEWPTWMLVLAIHGAWWGLVLCYSRMPVWLAHGLLIIVIAWYMSLQHELLHGHPTRWSGFNRLLGLLPLAVWYPYDVYRDSHLAHHRDEWLTVPGVDPESNYVTADAYRAMPPWRQALQRALRTVAGRLVVGPLLAVAGTWTEGLALLRRDPSAWSRAWGQHLLLLVVLLVLLQQVAGISPAHYLLGMAYPALALAMLRSVYEHRPAEAVPHRIVINEASWPWRLLFLNNNYHLVHHDQPGLPWYRIPAVYRAQRAEWLARCGGFHLQGYGSLVRQHGLRPIDSPVHPADMRPARPPEPASR
ncbi:MAG: fatty acid desaturase [Rhodoferax sp.]|nr:fatty acid desaturase [Rhodoferax sp.]